MPFRSSQFQSKLMDADDFDTGSLFSPTQHSTSFFNLPSALYRAISSSKETTLRQTTGYLPLRLGRGKVGGGYFISRLKAWWGGKESEGGSGGLGVGVEAEVEAGPRMRQPSEFAPASKENENDDDENADMEKDTKTSLLAQHQGDVELETEGTQLGLEQSVRERRKRVRNAVQVIGGLLVGFAITGGTLLVIRVVIWDVVDGGGGSSGAGSGKLKWQL